jgi:hypothetical protein
MDLIMRKENNNYIIDYDKQFDILGILIEKCKTCYSVEKNINNINFYLMKDTKTKRIVGIEIMDYSKTKKMIL